MIKAEKSVNLICCTGHREVDVYSLSAIKTDWVCIGGKADDGSEFKIIAPLSQTSFSIVVSPKPGPSREIGFKAEMDERSKQTA